MRSKLGPGLVVALGAYYLAILVYHGSLSAAYPYDLNYQEGFSLNDALRLVQGRPVWSDITQFPMVRSPYPPFYLLLFGALLGDQPSLLPGRLISLGATLAITVMLVWRTRGRGLVPAIAAGSVWVGSTFVYQWAPLARVDLLGLALSLGGVLWLESRVTAGRILGAALLCSLGLLTKQTLVAAPVAIVVFLLLRRDRRVIWFIALLALLVGGASALLNVASDGQYVRHVIFGNAANLFRFPRMVELTYLFFSLNAVLTAVAGLGLVGLWARHGVTLIGIYAPLALLTVLSIGNVSGDVNYFLEPTAALALLLPAALGGRPSGPPPDPLPNPPPARGRGPDKIAAGGLADPPVLDLATRAATFQVSYSAFVALVLVQLVLLVHVPYGFMTQYPRGPAKGATPVAEDVAVGNHVLEVVRVGGPTSLVEPAAFSALLGFPVWVQPIDLIAEERLNRWSPEVLVRSIEAHEWAVIVLNYKFFPGEVLEAIERAYVLTEGIASPNGFSYFIYYPRLGEM